MLLCTTKLHSICVVWQLTSNFNFFFFALSLLYSIDLNALSGCWHAIESEIVWQFSEFGTHFILFYFFDLFVKACMRHNLFPIYYARSRSDHLSRAWAKQAMRTANVNLKKRKFTFTQHQLHFCECVFFLFVFRTDSVPCDVAARQPYQLNPNNSKVSIAHCPMNCNYEIIFVFVYCSPHKWVRVDCGRTAMTNQECCHSCQRQDASYIPICMRARQPTITGKLENCKLSGC